LDHPHLTSCTTDYGESHYLKDPTASDAQPNSQAWVDGMSHAGWLDMTAYYASAFKTGAFPDIAEDKVYLWARPHARDASAASDPVGKPSNFQLVDDALWAVVFAKDDGKVVLSTQADGSGGQEFDVQKGVNKLSVPIAAGGSMKATLTRGGATVLEVDPEFTFQGAPQTFNYNAFVAFSKGDSA
jgi:glucan endo-1,3-alpha-glucosidase